MVQVVGVRFKKAGKVYYFDPGEIPINVGSKVIVETARGVEYGDVAIGPKEIEEEQVVQPLKKVVRLGSEKDAAIAAENKSKERAAFSVAQSKIEAHGLDMNLVDVEYTFDGSKNIFYFTSEGRVDFRELVRDLASVFRARIEMRQIGVRDEAKLLGGIGPCGRILCCTSFLGDFAPVSIRMAKDQNLSLNPSKISGLCGRLMCCLRYEQETYEEAKKDPRLAPGYVAPPVPSSNLESNPLEADEESPRRRIGLGNDSSPYGARIAQSLAEPVRRSERPRREEEGGGGSSQPPNRVAQGPRRSDIGPIQPRHEGQASPRREGERRAHGSRPGQPSERRAGPQERGAQAHAEGPHSAPRQTAEPQRGSTATGGVAPGTAGSNMPEGASSERRGRRRHHRGRRNRSGSGSPPEPPSPQ